MYTWTTIWRNDKMGFHKHVEVEAANYGLAVTKALDELSRKGYEPAVFDLISLKRQQEIPAS